MVSKAEILEENRRARRLQIVVDLVLNTVAQSDISVDEAAELAARTRQYALTLFPNKSLAYDIIYLPRFKRLMAEKYGVI